MAKAYKSKLKLSLRWKGPRCANFRCSQKLFRL